MKYGIFIIAIILLIVIVVNTINRKTFKLPTAILLSLVGLIIGIVIKVIFEIFQKGNSLYNEYKNFDFGAFFTEGILCFMLFYEGLEINFKKLVITSKASLILATLSTVITCGVFGVLFYFIFSLIPGIDLSRPYVFLISAIVSPIESLATGAILENSKVSKNNITIFKVSSIFNEVIGVVLFDLFINILGNELSTTEIVLVFFKETFGGILVGVLVAILGFILLRKSKEPVLHIVLSLCAVCLAYSVCELLEFSGVLATVSIGIIFSYGFYKYHARHKAVDTENIFDNFWKIIFEVLNYILFTVLGLTIIFIPLENTISTYMIIILSPILILIARFVGVFSSSFTIGKRHLEGFNYFEFSSIFTWGGLRGGVALALALSTKSITSITEAQYGVILLTTFSIILSDLIIKGLTFKPVYSFIARRNLENLKK